MHHIEGSMPTLRHCLGRRNLQGSKAGKQTGLLNYYYLFLILVCFRAVDEAAKLSPSNCQIPDV
jgi:hypothetical protein